MRSPLLEITIASAIAGLCGCAAKPGTGPNEKINQWIVRQSIEDNSSVETYQVDSPDVLLIVAPKIKELDSQRLTVRPDGKISVNLIGDVFVAGKTPLQIARELHEKILPYYRADKTDIAVQIVEFKSKVIYVFGQVEEPGTKPFTGKTTLLDALGQSRLNEFAWPQKIVVVRPNDDPTVHQKVTVDLKRMYQTGEMAENFVLEEGDLVYVPPSPLASINFTATKLLAPIRPTLTLIALGATGGI